MQNGQQYGLQGFDARQVQPAAGGSSLPVSGPDGHLLIITGGEIRPTQSGGLQLVWTTTIQEGEAAGQSGDLRFNIQNSSDDAVRIAWQEISAVCHVIGHLQPLQTPVGQELFNRPFRAIVQPDKNDDRYTRVTGYRDVNGNKPGKAGGGAQTASAPQAPSAPPQQPAGPQGGQPAAQGQPQGGGQWGQPQGQPAQNAGQWGQPQGQPQVQEVPGWGGQPQGQPAQQQQPAGPQGGQPGWGQPAQGNGQPGWSS